MKYVAVNYNFDPQWILEYTDDYLIYDRSDVPINYEGFDQSKIIRTRNVGHVDYDKLTYLVDYYDELPDEFYWGKINLWKSITKKEFDDILAFRKGFTPLLRSDHKTYSDKYGVVCFYMDGMYYERNDTWYLTHPEDGHFKSYGDFAKHFYLPNPQYLCFAPGGNYILTRDVVHRYPKEYYDSMRKILPYTQLPDEAHMCERSYYELWK